MGSQELNKISSATHRWNSLGIKFFNVKFIKIIGITFSYTYSLPKKVISNNLNYYSSHYTEIYNYTFFVHNSGLACHTNYKSRK